MFKPQLRWLLVVLLGLALLLRQGLAVVLLGLLGLALGFAYLWARWAFHRVTYTRTLSNDRAFVGDRVTLTVRLENTKLLGLPSLRIDDVVPAKLGYDDQHLLPHPQSHLQIWRRRIGLRPYEAVSWSIEVGCAQRGFYTFGPVHLEATDAFGFQSRDLDLPTRTNLIIYPELIALPNLQLRAQHPIGESRAPRQLLTDPSRTVGVRDYRREDPFKTIHWGATARRGELQTRVFEPTTSLDVAIMLNLDTFEHYWEGMRFDLIERMISAAATVATEAANQRLRFGLYVNGTPAESGQLIRIPPSRSPAQLNIVLEALATVVPYSITPFPNLLRQIGPSLDWGATIVMISAVPSDAVQSAVLRLKRGGRRVLWLYGGDDAVPQLPGIEIQSIGSGGSQWAERRATIVTAPGL
ncbi:MAG: DUF58 domain-containing protein [Chloroflexi bacterium]|nr:DUF58 domain-containing protein [Chloroflexota bacterium]